MKNPFRARRIRTEKHADAFFADLQQSVERRTSLRCSLRRRGEEAWLRARPRGRSSFSVVVRLRYDHAGGMPVVVFSLRPHASEIVAALAVAGALTFSAVRPKPDWPVVADFGPLLETGIFAGYLTLQAAKLFDVRADAFDVICTAAS